MLRRFAHLSCILVFLFQLYGCRDDGMTIAIAVKNELGVGRTSETVALTVKELKQRMRNIALASLVVEDAETGRRLVSQLVDENLDGRYDELIFQADFGAGETRNFKIQSRPADGVAPPPSRVYARFVPTRKDDFAWESDRIAYRMYGPALEASGEISSGVDVWVKSVRALILDKWYASGNDYHTDHGEGLDYYKVGPSRGCGGVALWDGHKLVPSNNFTSWKVIANGPIRAIFELTYAPWDFNGGKVSEIKRITLDAGHNLSRFESTFTREAGGDLEYVIGIVKRAGEGETKSSTNDGWLSYWEPAHERYGSTACGIALDPSRIVNITENPEHHLIIARAEAGKPAIYYAGAGWSKSGDFPNPSDWHAYVIDFSRRLQSPLRIQIR
ncbi:MAG: DUF4861 domain-containing protein [bacterium]